MKVSFEPTAPFRPPSFLSNPHQQTLLGFILRAPGRLKLERERWETPDGDFLDADWIRADPKKPHVLVLHGLEGSSEAGYVVETLRGIKQQGWGAVALNFRSCSGELNRTLRAYNTGDTTDARFALQRMRARGVEGPIYGVGFSLGGSVLLNLLAETGEDCPLEGASAVSVPFDLDRCSALIDDPTSLSSIYRIAFLRSLKAKTLAKCERLGGELDADAIRRAKTIRAFDDAVTAPLFGFEDAGDYYRRCSSGPKLHRIRRPTLLVTSEDDPIAPAATLPSSAEENPCLAVLRTQKGGHVGFVTRTGPRPRFWAEEQAVAFLSRLAT